MVDDIDRSIISHLQFNGRAPYTKIAEELDISEGAVRRRVNKLIDAGVMQIVAIVEPDKLGWNETSIIGINVQANRIEEVAEAVSRLPEVSYLVQAAGEFDLLAEVFCRKREHYVSFLNDKLQQIPGVEHTQSFMILKMHKLSYRWGEAEPPRVKHTVQASEQT